RADTPQAAAFRQAAATGWSAGTAASAVSLARARPAQKPSGPDGPAAVATATERVRSGGLAAPVAVAPLVSGAPPLAASPCAQAVAPSTRQAAARTEIVAAQPSTPAPAPARARFRGPSGGECFDVDMIHTVREHV